MGMMGIMRPACALFCLLCIPTAHARVETGLDILVEQHFAPLAGKRVGVITNFSAITYDRRHIIDVLASPEAKAAGVKLVAIFTPEHGLSGTARDGATVNSGKHEATGVPIFSLYQPGSYRPSPDMVKDVDALVFDIQDVGARFFTFSTTMEYTLEVAAAARIPYYVLDRPDPVNGVAVQGPLLDPSHFSYVGNMRTPVRYGMTIGELARMYNGENKLNADLHVISMQGWRRSMWFDETGLEWQSPSPNMRTLQAAILYTGVCLLEGRQVSVARGTDRPFEMVGAPWFQGRELAEYLNSRNIPGVRFLARRFRPTEAPYKDEDCDGLDIQLVNRDVLDDGLLGLEMVAATLKFHPGKFDVKPGIRLLGSDDAAARLTRGEDGATVNESIQKDLAAFRKLRQPYLLYD
jgi:uncharacterized protein YbbC (DUF1343 family)